MLNIFKLCNGLTSVTIGNSVISIGRFAFRDCTGLTSVTIPNSVTSIGGDAFEGCYFTKEHFLNNSALTDKSMWGATICDEETTDGILIKDNSVVRCRPVTNSAIIPNYVTSIGDNAFAECTSLTSVTIPNSVTSIGKGAFQNCQKLADVYCFAEKVPTTSTSAFYDVNLQNVCLHVPQQSLNQYSKTDPWSSFGNIVSDLTHSLIYMIDGRVFKSYQVLVGQTITPEPAPIKEGYTFSGWSEIPKTMPTHDVTVTGSFSINSYNLTYIVDGKVYKSLIIVYGAKIAPEKEPTKEGYTFSGWSEIPESMPAHDVTVTGSFSINSYALTYKVDGEVYKTLSLQHGAAITPEPTPIKEGHTFSGWAGLPVTMPAHDVTVIGSFKINSYTLTFMVDGKLYASYSLVYDSTLPSITTPKKEGHTFVGWGGLPTTMPAHDVIVQAQWSINQYKITYVVDDKVYKSYEIDYHATITPEPVPVKKGMTFSGWNNLPEIMPARDITISGTFAWTKKTIGYVIYQVTDTLNNYVSVIGNDISPYSNVEAEILSSVDIEREPYKVNRIENSTFYNCYSLTSIIISKSVTSIGETAFQDCTGLTSVTIGNSVASIGRDAFRGCTNLKKTIWLTNTPPSGYESVKSSINYVSNEQYVKLSNTIVYPFLSSLFEIDGICYIPVNPSERTCNAIDCRHNEKVANMDIASTVSYKV